MRTVPTHGPRSTASRCSKTRHLELQLVQKNLNRARFGYHNLLNFCLTQSIAELRKNLLVECNPIIHFLGGGVSSTVVVKLNHFREVVGNHLSDQDTIGKVT